jgi:hypothetical protein
MIFQVQVTEQDIIDTLRESRRLLRIYLAVTPKSSRVFDDVLQTIRNISFFLGDEDE